ncbi:MAG: hypothetical protein NTW37_05255 [Proteobacteria bacterium]|nr:hypothetical protein [Pseudomonadota bacterium]
MASLATGDCPWCLAHCARKPRRFVDAGCHPVPMQSRGVHPSGTSTSPAGIRAFPIPFGGRMDQWFMESYLRWLGQASDAELIDRKDAVAIALLQAGIDSELSRLLFDLINEEVDAREQVARMRRVRRRREAVRLAPAVAADDGDEVG